MAKKQDPIIVTRVHRGMVGTRIRVVADRKAVAAFDSILGRRVFILRPGKELQVKVRTSHWKVGERVSMTELVRAAKDWSDLPWDWDL